ncbi:MAG: hypothetical protein AAF646_05655 [Pseudomonadota bacterium]
MPADARFYERISRIERGCQWEPEGVISAKEMRRAAARAKARKKGGQKLSVVIAIAAAGIYFQPQVPDPILGFFSAPTTEAAIASLNQMSVFAGISAP